LVPKAPKEEKKEKKKGQPILSPCIREKCPRSHREKGKKKRRERTRQVVPKPIAL